MIHETAPVQKWTVKLNVLRSHRNSFEWKSSLLLISDFLQILSRPLTFSVNKNNKSNRTMVMTTMHLTRSAVLIIWNMFMKQNSNDYFWSYSVFDSQRFLYLSCDLRFFFLPFPSKLCITNIFRHSPAHESLKYDWCEHELKVETFIDC